jgi:4-amino-4-deoxy-L-arabinose transferase-like glycosyltransferase
MNEFSSRSLLTKFKTGLTKWRLLFLVFALTYAVFVSLDLTGTPIQWDEAAHLSNGVFLLRGDYAEISSFYPPLFDVVTVGFFRILGVTVVSARLVSLVFSLLSLWVVFELVCRLYGIKTALVASVLLGFSPGY